MQEILQAPTCRNCGHQVENDCPIGASCPKCERRFLPDPQAAEPAAGEKDFALLKSEYDRIFEELRAERGVSEALRGRVAELEKQAAEPKPKKGGARGDS